ncbi:MAG: Ferrous iron transport protein, partial [Oscillospiraceae bacterium]|nr:Ferrous iron transport protein [Oscillospiraceae bacterium]
MKHKMALAGNPNCGKTTLFNILTGSNQYVGNWPGVTVEKKIGKSKIGHSQIVDLPGIYSLSPYTMEEVITRDYILDEHPEVIINIIDGTNIERNMYLSVQLMELERPMVIAVNMMDDVKAKGEEIDCEKLSTLLGIPVVPISARKGENIQEVMHQAERLANTKETLIANIEYDTTTQNTLNDILIVLSENNYKDLPLNFFASKLLEGDKDAIKKLRLSSEQLKRIERIVSAYEATSVYGDRETMLADARYRFITKMVKQSVKKNNEVGVLSVSDKIDKIVTNRVLALPIFLMIMLLMFMLTFGPVGSVLSDGMGYFFENLLSPFVEKILNAANAPDWTHGLLVDAVIGGVGSILSFLPQIMILF